MTPKQKAHQIFDKMHNIGDLTKYESKQCAIIAIDEILNIKPDNPFIVNGYYIEPKKYWEQVKQEILAL